MKIGLVISKFNEEVTSRLADGAVRALKEAGLSPAQIVTFEVPGAFEIPLASKMLIKNHHVAGVVAVGAVIRGDTKHFDYVCEAAQQGCLQVSLDLEKPVGFGVLTTDTFEQAWERCRLDTTNKGYETAKAVLEMTSKLL